jgi:hypothetical protein
MELEKHIIEIDTTNLTCTIGNIENKGDKSVISNTSKHSIVQSSLRSGIMALGQKAQLSVTDNNSIYRVHSEITVPHKHLKVTMVFSDFILESVDTDHHRVVFRCSDGIYVKAYYPNELQAAIIPLIGKRVNWILSVRSGRLTDRNRIVVSVYEFF